MQVIAPPAGSAVVPLEEWGSRARVHRQRAHEALAAVVERRRTGRKHPIEDFLFDYYNLRPGQLMAWHPGAGEVLEDPEGEFAGAKFFVHRDGLSWVDVAAFVAARRGTVEWTRRLLVATAGRPASFGCFGMHEWAMVYHLQPDQTRHNYLPLRFEPDEVARVVEEVGCRCSHYDAFRFFTPDAVPLNAVQPTRELQPELDQPGCLHVNMDLYKWASKLVPLASSELVFDCWELARDIRLLDMRASAYDLREWGHEPVRVETPQGRAEYVRMQKAFSERSEPLREALVRLTDGLLD